MNRISTNISRTGPVLLSAILALLMVQSVIAEVAVHPYGDQTTPMDQPEGDANYDGVTVDVVILPPDELVDLVGPVALYPDDLLAIVLPASTYPLEIVQAARFLDQHAADKSLEPNEDWDESVTALLNYPEVLRMMNDDLDWTWKLGGAVLNQQQDVIEAVESFRDRAYAAGNLKSDDYQTVKNEGETIEIVPTSKEVIYVPYYEPQRVVIRQVEPVYYYYPRPYPVYYYPYPAHYSFYDGFFWGVTSAYRIGWSGHYLRVYHDSYWGHPYYGHRYSGHYYRRPSINVYNTWYVHNTVHRSTNRYRDGVRWRPRPNTGSRPGGHRPSAPVYRDRDRSNATNVIRQNAPVMTHNSDRRPGTAGLQRDRDRNEPVRRPNADRQRDTSVRSGNRPTVAPKPLKEPIRFRERPDTMVAANRPGNQSHNAAADRNRTRARQPGQSQATARPVSTQPAVRPVVGRKPARPIASVREPVSRDTNRRASGSAAPVTVRSPAVTRAAPAPRKPARQVNPPAVRQERSADKPRERKQETRQSQTEAKERKASRNENRSRSASKRQRSKR